MQIYSAPNSLHKQLNNLHKCCYFLQILTFLHQYRNNRIRQRSKERIEKLCPKLLSRVILSSLHIHKKLAAYAH